MTREEQKNQIRCWLSGMECGGLTADDVAQDLDKMILSGIEDLPDWVIEAAWNSTREEALKKTLKEALWELGQDPQKPISLDIFCTVIKWIREKWESGKVSWETSLARILELVRQYDDYTRNDYLWSWYCLYFQWEDASEFGDEGAKTKIKEDFVKLIYSDSLEEGTA